MKIYLAAPIFNPYQLSVVEAIKWRCEKVGHTIFSPYHESREIWAGRAPKDCTPSERRRVVFNNVHRLDWAEVVLAWVGGYPEGFTDPGVLWELGYAGCRSGVPALETAAPEVPISVGYIDETDTRRSMNLMLAGTLDLGILGMGQLENFILDLKGAMGVHELKKEYHPEKLVMHEEGEIS